MMKRIIIYMVAVLGVIPVKAGLTLDYCLQRAEENYPLIRKYAILERTLAVELSDINKAWLPQISLYGQATLQNHVPSFPQAYSRLLETMGQEMRGLSKFQYRVGADLNQTLWDGGASKTRREISVLQESVQKSQLDIELYALRERVQNIFFAILLTQEQIEQSNQNIELLQTNLERLRAMLDNGTAMRSDVDMVEAHILTVNQGIARAHSSLNGYKAVLGLYLGEDVADLTLDMPPAQMPQSFTSRRPELKLLEDRKLTARAMQRLSDVSLMPKVGLFAQAYYGYPGLDYFASMMKRELSFNILAGVKLAWNIDAFYTKKNTGTRTMLETERIDADTDVFLFNSRLQSETEFNEIEGMRKVMADDARIIELRGNVRKAAEAQLENGIIDTATLLSKITDENLARLGARFHEIQYVQEIYKLKHLLNQ